MYSLLTQVFRVQSTSIITSIFANITLPILTNLLRVDIALISKRPTIICIVLVIQTKILIRCITHRTHIQTLSRCADSRCSIIPSVIKPTHIANLSTILWIRGNIDTRPILRHCKARLTYHRTLGCSVVSSRSKDWSSRYVRAIEHGVCLGSCARPC